MILLLFPILFFARVKFCETGLWRLKIYAATLTFLICIVVFGLGLKYFVDPKRGSKAYYNIPYAAYANQLRSYGFNHGTIFADWHTNPIAGNFRAQFPNARVFDCLWTHYSSAIAKSGKCLVIWTLLRMDLTYEFLKHSFLIPYGFRYSSTFKTECH